MSMEFRSLAELVKVLGKYDKKNIDDPRLTKDSNGKISVKQVGQCEVTDADGGYLVTGEILTPIARSIAQKSTLFAKATKFYTSAGKGTNSGWIPFLNETHRTNAANQFNCRWITEGEDKVGQSQSKFAFDLHQKHLNKLYAVVTVTEELWADSTAFQQAMVEWIASPNNGSLIWYIERAMLYGTFATSMNGIFNTPTGTLGVATADPLDEASLKNYVKALAPATYATSEFYVSKENFNDILDINFTDDTVLTWKDGFMYLYGIKVNVLEQLYGTNSIFLGDMSQYGIALREGPLVESKMTLHVRFLSDEYQIRLGIRIGGDSFGSVYDLDDGLTVGTFIIPDTGPGVMSSSSSSSSEGYSSSSSSSSISSSSNSSSSQSTASSASSTSVSTQSSASSSSLSSASSESSVEYSSASSTSESSESSGGFSSASTSSSQSGMGACFEDYCGSGFSLHANWNATWTVTGAQHDSKPVYYSVGAGLYLFWDTTYSTWAMAETIGAAPLLWELTQVTPAACPEGAYDGNDAGTLTAGPC